MSSAWKGATGGTHNLWGGAINTFGFGQYRGINNYGTPYSSTVDGITTLDPSIHALQDKGLTNSAQYSGQLDQASENYQQKAAGLRGNATSLYGDLGNLRDQYTGNNSAYMQARVDPILQAKAQAIGNADQQHGLRGTSGSSFANQDYSSINQDFGRQEADQRAIGTNESLNAQRGLNSDMASNISLTGGIDKSVADNIYNTAVQKQQLNGENYDVAKARLTQELKSLGLDQQQVQQYIDEFEGSQKRRNATTNQAIQSSGELAKFF